MIQALFEITISCSPAKSAAVVKLMVASLPMIPPLFEMFKKKLPEEESSFRQKSFQILC